MDNPFWTFGNGHHTQDPLYVQDTKCPFSIVIVYAHSDKMVSWAAYSPYLTIDLKHMMAQKRNCTWLR